MRKGLCCVSTIKVEQSAGPQGSYIVIYQYFSYVFGNSMGMTERNLPSWESDVSDPSTVYGVVALLSSTPRHHTIYIHPLAEIL